MVITAGVLWAISGTLAQILFQKYDFSVDWLVCVRLILSGICLLIFSSLQDKGKACLQVFKTKQSLLQILIFGVIGMLGVQYTYFAAIEQTDVAIATLLQYLAPVLIVLFYCVRLVRLPSLKEMMSLVFAILGTFLLLTNGHVAGFHIAKLGIAWGLAAALTLAFYTIYSIKLRVQFGSMVTNGWGMLIGGLGIGMIYPPWNGGSHMMSAEAVYLVVLVVIVGTIIPFTLFVESTKYITATESSLLASIEPLTATFIAVIWLGIPFGYWQILGVFLIIGTVLILSIKKETKPQSISAFKVVKKSG